MMTGYIRVARDGTLVGWFRCDDAGTVRLVWMTKQGRSRSCGKRVADSIFGFGLCSSRGFDYIRNTYTCKQTIADTTYEADEAIREAVIVVVTVYT